MNYPALRYAIEQSPTSGAAWQVLVVIAYHADRLTGCCTANQRTLARETHIARSTVQLAIAELVGRGILEIIVEGTGHRSTTYRIIGHLEDRPPVHKPIEHPVDRPSVQTDGVVDRQVTARGPIVNLVVDRLTGSPYRNEGKREGKIFEGQPATAASVDDDPTADAVVVHSPRGNGVPPDATAALAALKASMHAQVQADRQAEADRLRDLLGPPTTEQETR